MGDTASGYIKGKPMKEHSLDKQSLEKKLAKKRLASKQDPAPEPAAGKNSAVKSTVKDPNSIDGNQMLGGMRKFFELIRFSHTIFALPFALLATVWAYLVPLPATEPATAERYLPFRWQDLAGILICMVAARSFAMAVNRLFDHDVDAENPRTAKRHLPAGELTRTSVTLFIVGCAALFVAGCALFLPNYWPLVLCLPVLCFLAGYSLTKRFTRFAHFWLGAALMLAPICAWIALRGSLLISHPFDLAPPIWLATVVLFWVSGFDIIYACQDQEYDAQAGLYSIPAKIGVLNALRVSKLCHLCMWIVAFAMTFAVPQLSLGWLFWIALAAVGLLLAWEHSVVSEKSLERVNFAFFQLNSVVSLVFLSAGSLDAWLR
jgi:4-hydroxybenzoate polyprenyltransferase